MTDFLQALVDSLLLTFIKLNPFNSILAASDPATMENGATAAIISKVIWDPMIPEIWLIIGFSLLCITCIYGLFFKIKGSVIRFLTGLALIAILGNPVVVEEQRNGQSDVVLLLIDDSPSQTINNRDQEADVFLEKIKTQLTQLSPPVEIRKKYLSEFTGQETGKTSNLYQFYQEASSTTPQKLLAGTIMVSDGQTHDGLRDILQPDNIATDASPENDQASRDQALSRSPVHIFIAGAENEIDRHIKIIDAPTYGLVGESIKINLMIEQHPKATSTSIQLPEIATLTIRADGMRPKRLQIPVNTPYTYIHELKRRGALTIAFNTDSLADELSENNNRTAITVNAVRDRLKVLLVSGVPHSGERVWRNLLKSDPSVDLVHFTILRPPEKPDDTPVNELSLIAFPT
ncbi:MAG: hypothetical protein R3261_14170, partial [Alphaproteobacteria bacterium]|nr:hypothetical protein [Alphaproteobacteria bacterium]